MLVCVVMNSGTWKGSSVLAQAVSQYGELNVSVVHCQVSVALEIKPWPVNIRYSY